MIQRRSATIRAANERIPHALYRPRKRRPAGCHAGRRGPQAHAEGGRGADRGAVRRRQPPRRPAALRQLSAAARRVTDPRSRGRGPDRRERAGRDRKESRRRGLRAHPGRRLRGVLRDTRRSLPPDPERPVDEGSRVAAGELVHRLRQRDDARAAQGGRDDPDPRRIRRHRLLGDPAREGARRRNRLHDGRERRKSGVLPQHGRRCGAELREQDWAAEVAEADRQARRGRRSSTWSAATT